MSREPIPSDVERVAAIVVDAAFKIHRALGPGLLESVYETCLVHELRMRGLTVKQQLTVPINYEGIQLDAGLRLDALVDEKLIVEIKAVEKVNLVFKAQLLSYLRLMGKRLGLLINFSVPLIKDGIERIAL